MTCNVFASSNLSCEADFVLQSRTFATQESHNLASNRHRVRLTIAVSQVQCIKTSVLHSHPRLLDFDSLQCNFDRPKMRIIDLNPIDKPFATITQRAARALRGRPIFVAMLVVLVTLLLDPVAF